VLQRPPPSPNAARQKRARERRKAGIVIMRAKVNEHRFAEALILAGRLSAEQTASRALAEIELERLVEDFIERWTHA
jgi:hypothetical protein